MVFTLTFGDYMKAWQKAYDENVLDEALKLADDVKVISNDGVEIIAEVESFNVTTYIQYNSQTHVSCTCSQSAA